MTLTLLVMQVIEYSLDEAAPVRTLSGEHACPCPVSWERQASSHPTWAVERPLLKGAALRYC